MIGAARDLLHIFKITQQAKSICQLGAKTTAGQHTVAGLSEWKLAERLIGLPLQYPKPLDVTYLLEIGILGPAVLKCTAPLYLIHVRLVWLLQ